MKFSLKKITEIFFYFFSRITVLFLAHTIAILPIMSLQHFVSRCTSHPPRHTLLARLSGWTRARLGMACNQQFPITINYTPSSFVMTGQPFAVILQCLFFQHISAWLLKYLQLYLMGCNLALGHVGPTLWVDHNRRLNYFYYPFLNIKTYHNQSKVI